MKKPTPPKGCVLVGFLQQGYSTTIENHPEFTKNRVFCSHKRNHGNHIENYQETIENHPKVTKKVSLTKSLLAAAPVRTAAYPRLPSSEEQRKQLAGTSEGYHKAQLLGLLVFGFNQSKCSGLLLSKQGSKRF